MSGSLWPHEPQHARPHCPSPTPRVHPNSCPSSRWCHPITSFSVIPFSSCPQSFPALESFPMSQLFTSGGQSMYLHRRCSNIFLCQSLWGPWVVMHIRFVWALWASLVGMEFDSKCEFTPPTILLGLLLCPWTRGTPHGRSSKAQMDLNLLNMCVYECSQSNSFNFVIYIIWTNINVYQIYYYFEILSIFFLISP